MKKILLSAALAAVISFSSVLPVFAVEAEPNAAHVWTQDEKTKEWICTDEVGEPVTGWAARDNDRIYYLNKHGVMKTGWIKFEGDWYYLDEKTGILATDKWIDNYYVNSEGVHTKTR